MAATPRALAAGSLAIFVLLGLAGAGCRSGDTGSPAGPAGEDAGLLHVTSSAFAQGGTIPARYCMTAVAGGRNVSLPLTWSGEVPGVASYAVVMIDRHPAARSWVHWALVDLPPSITAVEEGASPNVVAPARELTNTFGSAGYGGPQPPRGSGDHTYAITVYALDVARLDIPEAPTAREIDAAVEGHTLAYGTLTGVVGR